MPFIKGQSGNPRGRGTGKDLVNPKSISGSEIRDKELKQILRRLKPLTGKAIERIATLLGDEKTSEQTLMRAIALVMTEYPKLLNEVYKTSNKDDSDKDELETTPLVSFKVLNGGAK